MPSAAWVLIRDLDKNTKGQITGPQLKKKLKKNFFNYNRERKNMLQAFKGFSKTGKNQEVI